MPRTITIALALLLSAGTWFTQPASAIETGRDSSGISWVSKDKSFQASIRKLCAPTSAKRMGGEYGSALLSTGAGIVLSPAVFDHVRAYQSRSVAPFPAFCLGQRPPPQAS